MSKFELLYKHIFAASWALNQSCFGQLDPGTVSLSPYRQRRSASAFMHPHERGLSSLKRQVFSISV